MVLHFSKRDVSAAENIGRVIAQRCKESGITSMALYIPPSKNFSEKVFMALHNKCVCMCLCFEYLNVDIRYIICI